MDDHCNIYCCNNLFRTVSWTLACCAFRDYVNIIDKDNWRLFGIYALMVWILTILIIPGIFYSLSFTGIKISDIKVPVKKAFMLFAGALLPLGLAMWIAFVIPMFFVNITFIFQSISDPFGWGWDFFGTANIPWHQLFPKYIPWLQGILVLFGLHFSLRVLRTKWIHFQITRFQTLMVSLPVGIFLISVSVFMLFFFVN